MRDPNLYSNLEASVVAKPLDITPSGYTCTLSCLSEKVTAKVHGKYRSLDKKGTFHGCDKFTNRSLISEDRSTEATLRFTISHSFKSRLHRIYI